MTLLHTLAFIRKNSEARAARGSTEASPRRAIKVELAEIRAERRQVLGQLFAGQMLAAEQPKAETPRDSMAERVAMYQAKPQAVDAALEDWVATPSRILAAAAKARAAQAR